MSEGLLSTEPITPPAEDQGLSSSGFSFTSVIGDDGSFAPGWHDHLDGDYKAAAATAANYKTLPEMAKGLYEARKALSQRDERVAVPGANATPEQIAKYREALGVPEKYEEYPLNKPESLPDEMWDDKAAVQYKELFHKLNVPPKAANEIVQTYLQMEQGKAEAMEAYRAGEMDRARQELQNEFGVEYTKQLDLARRMALTAGVDPNDASFNSPAVIKALAFAGRNLGEDRMISSQESGGMQSGMARARDISQNPQNPMHERYRAGDPDVVALVTKLIQGKL